MNSFKFFGTAIRSVLQGIFRGDVKLSRSISAGLASQFGVDVGNNAIGNFIKSQTGSGLTTAQEEQNAWASAEAEAAFNREKELYGERYQMAVSDMEKAGLNPALMYGGNALGSGVQSPMAQSSSISTGQGLGGIMNLVSQLNSAKIEKELGEQRNTIFEEQVEVEKYKAETERMLASSNIKVNELRNNYQSTLNYILDSSKDIQIDQIKNNNELTKEQMGYTDVLKQSVLQQMDLVDLEMLTEQQKAGYYAAEAAFRSMESWQIVQMTPALKALYEAEAKGVNADTAAQEFANKFNVFLKEKGAWQTTFDQMKDSARITHSSAEVSEGTIVNDFAFFMATLGKSMLPVARLGVGAAAAGTLFNRGFMPYHGTSIGFTGN